MLSLSNEFAPCKNDAYFNTMWQHLRSVALHPNNTN